MLLSPNAPSFVNVFMTQKRLHVLDLRCVFRAGVSGAEHRQRVPEGVHLRGPVRGGLRGDPRVSGDDTQMHDDTEFSEAQVLFAVVRIIPIYLVHRPSNEIPYATLEEELIGDFVKYSVKDGKEINLLRRDSEAGQKCCTFQHWVYHKTEGNLLVTDMQGAPRTASRAGAC